MSYKYDFDTKVKAKRELIFLANDEETGEEYKIAIPQGAEGIIVSMGRSSIYRFLPMYDVEFEIPGEIQTEVTFLQKDLEYECFIGEKGKGQ